MNVSFIFIAMHQLLISVSVAVFLTLLLLLLLVVYAYLVVIVLLHVDGMNICALFTAYILAIRWHSLSTEIIPLIYRLYAYRLKR